MKGKHSASRYDGYSFEKHLIFALYKHLLRHNVNCHAQNLKMEGLFSVFRSRGARVSCLFIVLFFCLPRVMLKHLVVICEQLLCWNVNWARQIIPDTVSAPYCKSNLAQHSPFPAHRMQQMPGLGFISSPQQGKRWEWCCNFMSWSGAFEYFLSVLLQAGITLPTQLFLFLPVSSFLE